ncbi:DctP family TRAP transporter solute-binding subunit [Candidatus Uhrbacteria bacterium]|nr:DctP family TRAP transporter solute-binding subunit [Candidatus Uhrbacteria bacterium]
MTLMLLLGAAVLFAGGQSEAATGAQQELPTVRWKLSHTTDPDGTYHKGALAFKEYVEDKTNGKLIIDIHHSGVLGWEREVLEAMQIGTIEATIPSLGPFAVFVPSYNVFNLPFTFQGPEHMLEAYKSPVMDKLKEAAEEEGFVVAEHFLPTFRYPLYGGHPVRSVDDFKGLKFRTMGVPAHIDTYKALGANVTSMAFKEVYSALQMGTVDGTENFYANLYTMKFHEQTKYISNLPILNNAAAFVFSKVAYDKLPEEYQKVLIEGAKVGSEHANEIALEEEQSALQAMLDAGIEKVFVDDFTPFIKATEAVSEKYLAEMEPWVADVRAEIMALAK